jgi:hypothetical protein
VSIVRGALLLALAPFTLGAQRSPVDARPAPGSELTISVVTFGQGDPVWERFGHNAIRVEDASRGTDVAYNWGTFDFQQPNFVGRFLTGDTRYWLDTVNTPLMMQYYAQRLNRGIVVQRLALTPAQRVKVRDFVEWNLRPENRYYRYDYFRDNCSTRLRDVVDLGTGGALRRALAARTGTRSYRSESLRLVDGMPLTQAGMHLALGEPADRPLTAWEEAFVPMRLRDELRTVRVPGDDGSLVPLVAEDRILYTAIRAAEAERAPSLVGRFLVVGVAIAGLLAWLGMRARAGSRGAARGLATVGATWSAVTGLAGLVILLAWTVTRHVFWADNENLLQLSPIALALAVLLPLTVARQRLRRATRGLALATLALSMLGLLLKALPWFDQSNLAAIALALPVHASLAWAIGLLPIAPPSGEPTPPSRSTAPRARATV